MPRLVLWTVALCLLQTGCYLPSQRTYPAPYPYPNARIMGVTPVPAELQPAPPGPLSANASYSAYASAQAGAVPLHSRLALGLNWIDMPTPTLAFPLPHIGMIDEPEMVTQTNTIVSPHVVPVSYQQPCTVVPPPMPSCSVPAMAAPSFATRAEPASDKAELCRQLDALKMKIEAQKDVAGCKP